jgi:hypothetical protein
MLDLRKSPEEMKDLVSNRHIANEKSFYINDKQKNKNASPETGEAASRQATLSFILLIAEQVPFELTRTGHFSVLRCRDQ